MKSIIIAENYHGIHTPNIAAHYIDNVRPDGHTYHPSIEEALVDVADENQDISNIAWDMLLGMGKFRVKGEDGLFHLWTHPDHLDVWLVHEDELDAMEGGMDG